MSEILGYESINCLLRAWDLLSTGKQSDMLYAALELRLGIEDRLHQVRNARAENFTRQRGDWKIAALGKELEGAFKTGDKICVFGIQTTTGYKSIFYTPVSRELRTLGGRIGDMVHYRSQGRDEEWWMTQAKVLRRCVDLLSTSLSGAMLGPPLKNTKTGKVYLSAYVDPRDVSSTEFIDLTQATGLGAEQLIHIDYLEALPDDAKWVNDLLK